MASSGNQQSREDYNSQVDKIKMLRETIQTLQKKNEKREVYCRNRAIDEEELFVADLEHIEQKIKKLKLVVDEYKKFEVEDDDLNETNDDDDDDEDYYDDDDDEDDDDDDNDTDNYKKLKQEFQLYKIDSEEKLLEADFQIAVLEQLINQLE